MTGERFYPDEEVVSADGFFGDVDINEVADGRYDQVWKTALDAYAGFKLAGIRGLALVDDIVYATTGDTVVALRSV